jgi:peptidoglycan/LPS O-acetylase OafA/YrhL
MAERSLQYRPYLDGLRGIAVLLVFVFHAARPGLPGGFIGVDIFFVLSGYLITRILLTQHATAGKIRISDFYARRIRRLMPAVILVVLVVVVREAVWGDIIETATRLRDAVATLFYVENWNLIHQADQYFEASLSPSPLRHAWSLSIEEQFYLASPSPRDAPAGRRCWCWQPRPHPRLRWPCSSSPVWSPGPITGPTAESSNH